ncbi:hypothetical protein BHM03_00050197 [Ensete ventricosum]|nr:hypothetical protein BHM03_00050197 [Ensete ventricosum]
MSWTKTLQLHRWGDMTAVLKLRRTEALQPSRNCSKLGNGRGRREKAARDKSWVNLRKRRTLKLRTCSHSNSHFTPAYLKLWLAKIHQQLLGW